MFSKVSGRETVAARPSTRRREKLHKTGRSGTAPFPLHLPAGGENPRHLQKKKNTQTAVDFNFFFLDLFRSPLGSASPQILLRFPSSLLLRALSARRRHGIRLLVRRWRCSVRAAAGGCWICGRCRREKVKSVVKLLSYVGQNFYQKYGSKIE